MQLSKPVALTTLAGATLALASTLLAPAASARVFPTYPDTGGAYLNQSLTLGANGSLYGTAPYGGRYGYGSLFQYDPQSPGLTVLYSFTGKNGDGAVPEGPLVADGRNNLFGTTNFGGGSADSGSIYVFTGGSRYVQLYQFPKDASTSGILPMGSLLEYAPNSFVGTASYGNSRHVGAVYTFTVEFTSGGTPKLAAPPKFYSFGGKFTNSASPVAGLVVGPDNRLYGTAVQGGIGGYGTIYTFNPATGAIHTVHDFAATKVEGIYPVGQLLSANGLLYGTCSGGGPDDDGTIYSFDPVSGDFHILYRFHGASHGDNPQGSLALGPNGDLFATAYGGTIGYGVILDFTGGDGAPNFFSSFDGANGAGPVAGLTLGGDGLFYGVTYAGGSAFSGALYSLDPATLKITLLQSFGTTL